MLGFTGFGNLFTGFTLKKSADEENKVLDKNTVIEIENEDASEIVDNLYSTTAQFNGHNSLQTQAQMINEYRVMALHPEVDNALDDIINAMISTDEEEDPVSLDLEGLEVGQAIKDKMVDEFEDILELMNFNVNAYERAKQWYVDGRLIYNVVVDETRPKEGIKKLVPLDARAVRKVKEVTRQLDQNKVEKISNVETYYVYDTAYALDSNSDATKKSRTMQRKTQALKMSADSVVMCHSGVLSSDNTMILSNLEKARKALNNLRMLEDALVVYRITRAPERRAFYVDVGSLPKKSAEEYVTRLMNKYKSKMVYDSNSGTVQGNAHQISMLEDFWLPRREGGTGTQIDTLQGGANLGDIEDVLYFQRKLYKSLNVPSSRLEQGAVISLGGRSAEITRDEWKFGKFVTRLRRRFSELFLEIMKRQLILKGITTPDDWEKIIRPGIKFKYASDSFMKDQQESELLADQINMLGSAEPFVGKYFSRDMVKRRVLGQSDDEMKTQAELIKKEIAAGEYLDPAKVAESELNSNLE